MRKRLAVFASGRGSNAAAIYEAMQAGHIEGDMVCIVTDKIGAPIVEKARDWGIPAHEVSPKEYSSKVAFEKALVNLLAPYEVDGVILAGYMRLLGPTFIEAYENKILNIHPALLPSFPGLHAQGQAVKAGVKVSGCTVHFVDTGMDSGPIIAQRVVPVYASDDEDSLASRILVEEHQVYPEVVAQFCKDQLRIDGKVVHILDK